MGKPNEDEFVLPWPRSHTDDPDTSHEAEAQMRKSGRLGKQMRAVFQLVQDNPMRTSTQLARISGMTLYQVRRRLSDLRGLERVGRIRIANERECAWVEVVDDE